MVICLIHSINNFIFNKNISFNELKIVQTCRKARTFKKPLKYIFICSDSLFRAVLYELIIILHRDALFHFISEISLGLLQIWGSHPLSNLSLGLLWLPISLLWSWRYFQLGPMLWNFFHLLLEFHKHTIHKFENIDTNWYNNKMVIWQSKLVWFEHSTVYLEGFWAKLVQLWLCTSPAAYFLFVTLVETSGVNVIKLLWKIFMVNYRGKKTLKFLGLKYNGNLLSYCSNLPSFQGKFNVINGDLWWFGGYGDLI
jgi:hypothetical protein